MVEVWKSSGDLRGWGKEMTRRGHRGPMGDDVMGDLKGSKGDLRKSRGELMGS